MTSLQNLMMTRVASVGSKPDGKRDKFHLGLIFFNIEKWWRKPNKTLILILPLLSKRINFSREGLVWMPVTGTEPMGCTWPGRVLTISVSCYRASRPRKPCQRDPGWLKFCGTIENEAGQTGEITQSLNRLLFKHRDPSSIASTHFKKPKVGCSGTFVIQTVMRWG